MRNTRWSRTGKLWAPIAISALLFLLCVGEELASAPEAAGEDNPTVKAVVNQVNGEVNVAVNQVDGAVNGAINQVDGAVNGAVSQVNGAVNGAVSQVNGAVNGAVSQVNGAVNGVVSQVNGAVNGAVSQVNGAVNGAVSQVNGAVNGAIQGVAVQLQGTILSQGQLVLNQANLQALQSTLNANLGGLTSSLTTLGSLTSGVNINQLNTLSATLNLPNAGDALNSISTALGGGTLTASLGGLGTTVNGLLQGLNNDIDNLSSLSASQLANVQGLVNNLGSLNNTLANLTTNFGANGLAGSITGILNGTAIGGITNALNSLNGLTTQLGQLTNLGGLVGSLNGQLSNLTSLVNGGLANVANALNLDSLDQITDLANQLGDIATTVNNIIANPTAAAEGLAGKLLGFTDINMLLQDNCPAANCSNEATPNQDSRYRDLLIDGVLTPIDNTQPQPAVDPGTGLPALDPGLQGSMPGKGGQPVPMYTKNTPTISLVKYFPWLYKEVDVGAQMYGQLYRGVGNNGQYDVNKQTDTTGIVNSVAAATDDQNMSTAASNVARIDTSDLNNTKCTILKTNCGTDFDVYERWVRLQYDSCSDQYILPEGLDPAFIFSPEWKSHLSAFNETVCQPLKLSPVPCVQDQNNGGKCKPDSGESDGNLYDYRPWGYIELAWQNLLDTKGQGYTLNGGGNSAMPLPMNQDTDISTNVAGFSDDGAGDIGNPPVVIAANGGMILQKPIAGENQYGTPFNAATPGYGNAYGTYQGALTTPNQLAQHPYERIWDPSHPFSPRWDFKKTDRSYSTQARLNGTPYHGYDISLSPCIVRCAAVPVDIMSFRAQEFNACMTCRINVNTNCFWNQVIYLLTPLPFVCGPDPNAVLDTVANVLGCHPPIPGLACKTLADLQGNWPLCSTKYDYPNDSKNGECSTCLSLAGDANPKGGVTKCCNDLAQALVPINTLKIRNTQLDPTLLDPTTNTTPEGYNFKAYFGDHMPYMRWWDTGTAAGGSNGISNYNPNCDVGQYDTLVGVGREACSDTDGTPCDPSTQSASYCRYGGGAGLSYPDPTDPAKDAISDDDSTGDESAAGGNQTTCTITIPNPDALTSWAELKQYQATALRNYGLNCLPQYEKVFKQFGAEDGVFGQYGYYNVPWPEPNVQPMGVQSGTTQGVGDYQLAGRDFPLGWRGYLSDPVANNGFPKFPTGTGANVPDGLDNAQPGDIIFLTHQDVVNSGANPQNPNQNVIQTMPFMAVVTGVSGDYMVNGKPASPCQHYVTVVDINNGKYPDVCGNTSFLDLGQTRTIYRDWLPPNVHEALNPAGVTITDGCANGANSNPGDIYTTIDGKMGEALFNDSGNCMDPKLYICTPGCLSTAGGSCPLDQDIWNVFHIYRPNSDVRQ